MSETPDLSSPAGVPNPSTASDERIQQIDMDDLELRRVDGQKTVTIWRREFDALIGELRDARRLYEDLRDERAVLWPKAQVLPEVKAQLAAAQAELRDTRAENAELRAAYSTVCDYAETVDEATADRNDLRAKLADETALDGVRVERDSLRDQLQRWREIAEAYRRDLHTVEVKWRAAERQLAAVRKALNAIDEITRTAGTNGVRAGARQAHALLSAALSSEGGTE